jgi:hypothetical protein
VEERRELGVWETGDAGERGGEERRVLVDGEERELKREAGMSGRKCLGGSRGIGTTGWKNAGRRL